MVSTPPLPDIGVAWTSMRLARCLIMIPISEAAAFNGRGVLFEDISLGLG